MSAEFSITINSEQLARGLRPSKRVPRNSRYLVTCVGAVGRDGILQIIDQLTRMGTAIIADSFPYPQLFVFTNMIVVCSATEIFEWVAGSLVLKLTVAAGSTWSAVEFYDYAYLSNGKVAVIRDSISKVYSITTTLPTASSICNFQGQVIIGAPDTKIPGASLTVKVDPIVLTTTQQGWWFVIEEDDGD